MLMEESVLWDGSKCKITLHDDCIAVQNEKKGDTSEERINWDDVLKIEASSDEKSKEAPSFTLHYIQNLGRVESDSKGIRWRHTQKKVASDGAASGAVEKLESHMSKLFTQKVIDRPSRLLMLINPKSGNGKAESIYNKTVEPLLTLMEIKVDRKVMKGVEETRKLLNDYDLTSVDGVVVMGGDGSMADVINSVVMRCQREASNDLNSRHVALKPMNVKLGILPAGTGQCDTLVLNGSADTETSVLHIIKGNTINGDLISCHNGDRWVYCGIVGGGVGYFADLLIYAEAKRWLGLWRYLFAFGQAVWYLNTFEAEVEILKQTDEKGDGEWEKLDGRFLEVGVSPRGTGHGRGFPGFMEVIIQREASRGQVMKYVGKFVNADQALFDFPHVKSFRAQEMRVRLPHVQKQDEQQGVSIGNAVHVDGELFPITDQLLTFKLHRHVVNFFGIERDASEILHKK